MNEILMHFSENGNNLIFELKCDTHLMALEHTTPITSHVDQLGSNSSKPNPPKSNNLNH
jgi:hypothetical protein